MGLGAEQILPYPLYTAVAVRNIKSVDRSRVYICGLVPLTEGAMIVLLRLCVSLSAVSRAGLY